MATIKPKFNLGGLARRLISDGLLDEEQANTAFEEALKAKVPFVSYLVEKNILKAIDIANSASHEFGVPLFDLESIDTEVLATSLVEEKLIRKHHAIPLYKRGNRLFLGVSDPTNHRDWMKSNSIPV